MTNHQVLIIEPQTELKFKVDAKGHFEQGFTNYMRLTNPTSDTVLFKIKTTAPKKYCVRPNSGSLEPNSKVDIAITPQPVCVENSEKSKHKFMVQSVIAPEAKYNIDQVWKEVSAEQMMDYKIKCVFELPGGANLGDSGDQVVQNDGTKKRVVAEDAKPAPANAIPKPDVGDNKSVTDIQLQEEERLRQENLQLKEDLLRLRNRPVASRHSYSPEKPAQTALMPWIAIGMALLGIIIGKFFI